MSVRNRAMAVLAICASCASPVFAQSVPEPQSLSLTQAVQLALKNNPAVKQANAAVQIAQDEEHFAASLPSPTLSLAQHTGVKTGGLDEDILVTQDLPLGDKLRQRIYAARSGVAAAKNQYGLIKSNLVYQVQQAYYTALQAEAQYRLAQDNLRTVQRFQAAAKTQFKAGTVPQSNVVRSEIAVAQADQTLTDAQASRSNALDKLTSLLDFPQGQQVKLTGELNFTPIHSTLDELQAYALIHRQDLLAAQQTTSADTSLVHLAKAQSQPDMFVEYRHTPLDFRPGGNSLRVGIIFPLFDLGAIRSKVHAAQAQLRAQSAATKLTALTVQLDVKTAYNNLVAAQRVVQSFQNGRLQRAKELLRMVQIGYSHGANSYLEYIDAQQTYAIEQTNTVNALASYDLALAALQHAVGGKLP